MKRQATDWENIFANHLSNQGEYIRNSPNSTVKKKSNQKTGQRHEKTFSQSGYRDGT